MPYIYNPFTNNLDYYEGSSSSGAVNFSVVSENIACTSVGATSVFTVPNGNFFLTSIGCILQSQIDLTVQPFISIGTNFGGPYNDMLPSTQLPDDFSSGSATSEYANIFPVTTGKAIEGQEIFIQIATAATATSLNVKFVLNGYLI